MISLGFVDLEAYNFPGTTELYSRSPSLMMLLPLFLMFLSVSYLVLSGSCWQRGVGMGAAWNYDVLLKMEPSLSISGPLLVSYSKIISFGVPQRAGGRRREATPETLSAWQCTALSEKASP